MELNRRTFIQGAGLTALTALAGCSTTSAQRTSTRVEAEPPRDPMLDVMYGEKLDEPFPLPAIPYRKINPKFYRQQVENTTNEPPGTLVVDTGNHFLYFTQADGSAMRYGVGLGRAGFAWSGRGVIQYKRQWPKWTPPVEMFARQPELTKLMGPEGSMEPGLKNPLGARALYIFQNGEDTLYRVHGSPEWWTVGKSVSSGCVRMINQDICDLFNRVPNKTPIVVTNLSGAGYEEARNPEEQPPRYDQDEDIVLDRQPVDRDDILSDDDNLEGPMY